MPMKRLIQVSLAMQSFSYVLTQQFLQSSCPRKQIPLFPKIIIITRYKTAMQSFLPDISQVIL